MPITNYDPWYIQYHTVRAERNWRSWPVIRYLRAIGFRRATPLGEGRQGPISVIRYYWAEFLEYYRKDFCGRALEIGDTNTIRYYGGNQLTHAEALDLSPHNVEVKVVADLTRADEVAGDQYDCFLVQFSTNVLYDIESALYHAVRLLKPGGVLLTNFWTTDFYFHNGLDMGTGGPIYMHHWFTPIQVANLLHGLALTPTDYELRNYGNLLTKVAFLLNVPAREFTTQELDYVDPSQPLLVCVRVVKPIGWQAPKPRHHEPLWLPTGKPQQLHPETGHFGNTYLPKKAD